MIPENVFLFFQLKNIFFSLRLLTNLEH